MKKITRRTVLRASGLAAASLALSGCAPAGSACVGNGFSDWLKQTFGKDSAASSESAEAAAPDAGTPDAGAASELPAESADTSLPAYNADPLTGEPRRSNGRMVGVMVNNISNTQRQNARPQRGIGSADLLIESNTSKKPCKWFSSKALRISAFTELEAKPIFNPRDLTSFKTFKTSGKINFL